MRVVDPNSLWGRVAHFFNLNTAPHLVLLDVGMTAELSPHDQSHIISFFKVSAPLLVNSRGRLPFLFTILVEAGY